MKLLVTGGAGFIGSNYVRYVLRETDDEVVVYDALTYAGQPVHAQGRRRRPALLVREGRHLRPGHPRGGDGRRRRGGPLRGREPRRPLDRRLRRLRQHELLRHQHRDGHGPPPRDRPRRPHRHRRGVRLGGGRVVQGGRSARAAVAVLRVQGRAPTSSRSATTTPTACRSRSPAARTTSARTSTPRRPSRCSPRTCSTAATVPLYGDGLNERDWLFVDDHCSGRAPRAPLGRARRDLQHRRRQRDAQPGARRQAPRPCSARTSRRSTTSPTASGTTGATRSTSPRSPRSAGPSSARSTRPSRPPSTGTAPTSGGGVRSSRPADAGPHHRRVGPARHRPRASPARPRATRSRRAAAPSSTSPTATPCTRRSSALRPDVVLHAGAWTAVDACEGDPERAFHVNALGTEWVADAARRAGVAPRGRVHRLRLRRHEARAVPRVGSPQPAVGLRPVEVGRRARRRGARAGLVRRPHRVGVRRPRAEHGQDRARAPRPPRAGLRRRPARLSHLHRRPGPRHPPAGRRPACRACSTSPTRGPPPGTASCATILEAAGADPDKVRPITTAELDPPRPAPRPANSVLDNAALRMGGFPLLPHYRDSLDRLVQELQAG